MTMTDSAKPEFKKSAEFTGSDDEYNQLVWEVVEDFGPAAIDGRTLNALRIDDRDFKKAYDYKFPKP
jgi:hypothetical protein